MRNASRSLGTLLLAVGVATCSDAPSTAAHPQLGGGRERVAFTAVFSPGAAAAYANRADFNITFDNVRIVIVRPVADTVKDTTITFRPDQPDLTVDLEVEVHALDEIFDAAMDYRSGNNVVFHGQGQVQAHPAGEAGKPQQITLQYTGAGSTAARLVVSPKTASLVAPSTATFTMTAFDANNNAVSVPVTWSVSDPTLATIAANGSSAVLTPGTKRGTVTVTARSITDLSDNASVTISLPPTSMTLVSGGGQSGKVGSTLAQPAVVRVLASDNQGVPGVTVTFAPATGGAVGTTNAVTDANGQAQSTLTLGNTAGPESFAAAATGAGGALSVSIPETATAGDPAAIVPASGGGQQDTVKHALKNPLVAKVTDQFGNPVANATVSWARTAGSGSLAGASSTTNADGLASMSYTLGDKPGTETVTASVSGATSSATFTVQAIPAGPAAIAIVSGDGQSGRVLEALAAPFVVKVTDETGSPVSGVLVSWTAVNGTIANASTTDANGQASATMTLGSNVGSNAASATASITTPTGTKSVSFSVNVQRGTVARLVFKTQPANAVVGSPLNAVQVSFLDAAGNPVPATNNVTIALGNNPAEAMLGGTLTRGGVAGVATFNDLTVSAAGSGYTLIASSPGLPSITSGAFNVSAAQGASKLIFVDVELFNPIEGQPSVTTPVGVVPTFPAIRSVDASGNPIPNVPITISISQNSQVIFTATGATDTRGVLFVSSNDVPPSVFQTLGSYLIVATSTAIPGSTLTLPLTVTASGTRFVVTANPTSPAPGATAVVTAQLVDAQNNPVSTPTPRTVSWTVTGAGSVNPGVSTTNAQGAATTTFTAATAAGTVAATGDTALARATGSLVITPLAAAQIAAVAQVVTSTVDGTQPWPVGSYPSVRVLTASSVPVPNVAVTFTPVPGGECFIPSEDPSTSVMTDANGVAALSAATLKIDRSTEGSCLVTATTGTLSAVISAVVTPVTGIKTWIGGTSSAWDLGANWLGGSPPAATDSAFVPGWTLHRPLLSGPTTIAGLRPEAGGAPYIDVGNSVLTINGDLVNTALAIVATGSGSVVFTKPGAGTIAGTINAPVSIGAASCTSSYSVTTPGSSGTTGLFVNGPLTVNCPLTIQRAAVVVTGSVTVQGSGKLVMTPTGSNPSQLVTTGDVTFNGADETGSLTGGSEIIVGGNMTIGPSPNAFVASPTSSVTFQPPGNHSITVASGAAPVFGQLVVEANTLTVNGNITADATNVMQGASLVSSGTITTAQAIQSGTGSYAGVNTLVVTGPRVPDLPTSAPVKTILTNAAAAPALDVTIAGAVEVQGTLSITNNVTVTGNFSVTGTNGELVMQTDNMHLTIGGDATFAGKAATRLTNGILQIGGNFIQSGAVSQQSFAASGGHLTLFANTAIKRVTFATPDSISHGGSAFSAVQVAAGGGIDVGSSLIVTGLFTNSGQVQFLTIPVATQIGSMDFRDNSRTIVQSGATVNINGPAQFDSTNAYLQIDGTMTAASCLPVGGPFPAGASFCMGF